MELTIGHELILKVLRFGIPLTTNKIATKTHTGIPTAKKRLLELEKEGKVERTGKKWKIKGGKVNEIIQQ